MAVRHFLSLLDLERDEVVEIIRSGIELKQWRSRGYRPPLFEGKTLAMIFEKSSTRTRVSFEVAMAECGGAAVFLNTRETQLGRGEPPEDTARVLSEMADAIMIRTYEHEILERFASLSRVPVINGLTNSLHPCQLLADLMTFFECRGEIRGRRVAWVGDGNNMCNSYINAAALMGFELRIATPPDYEPDGAIPAGAAVEIGRDPVAAVKGVDLVVTDVWASMGQEEEAEARKAVFAPYKVDEALMGNAATDALFMHCLPAHRGEEVSARVLDHPDSIVWAEAGNRLHAQKSLLAFLFAQA